MASVEFVEEEFRLAIAQPTIGFETRREAATAYAALADHRARLEAAEARYHDQKDLEGLDEALRIFEAISVTPAWPACAADRQSDLGRRVSHIYLRQLRRARPAPRDRGGPGSGNGRRACDVVDR